MVLAKTVDDIKFKYVAPAKIVQSFCQLHGGHALCSCELPYLLATRTKCKIGTLQAGRWTA